MFSHCNDPPSELDKLLDDIINEAAIARCLAQVDKLAIERQQNIEVEVVVQQMMAKSEIGMCPRGPCETIKDQLRQAVSGMSQAERQVLVSTPPIPHDESRGSANDVDAPAKVFSEAYTSAVAHA